MTHGNKTMPLDSYPYMENDLKSKTGGISALVERVNTLEEKQKTKWYELSEEDKNVIFDTLNEDIVSFVFAAIKICGNVVQLHINLKLNIDFQINTFLNNIGNLNKKFFNKAFLMLKSYFVNMRVESNGSCDLFNYGMNLPATSTINVYDTYILTDEEISILHEILKNHII